MQINGVPDQEFEMASDIASDSEYSEEDEQSSQSEDEYDEELVTEQPKAQEVKGEIQETTYKISQSLSIQGRFSN